MAQGELTRERLQQLVLGRLRQLQESEWLAPAQFAEQRRLGLAALLDHAIRFSPLMARRAAAAGVGSANLRDHDVLARLPLLDRRDLQADGDLFCTAIPQPHEPLTSASSSGSTGEPVTVHHTLVSRIDYAALTLREHLWHGSDFTRVLAAVRTTFTTVQRGPDWGSPVNLVAQSGPSLVIPNSFPPAEIARLLAEARPGQLLINPSTLAHLCDHLERSSERLPGMQRVRTIAEAVLPGLRERVRLLFDAPLHDVYSSRELGHIAVQCPVSGLYHAVETLIVEVLDAAGGPCGEGEEGTVAITDLRNFATPLVRYRIGDRAVVGPPCPCGRGLPTLVRVLGRERNLVTYPDGRRGWPQLENGAFWTLGPVEQFQFVQHSRERIEVRLAVSRAMRADEEAAMAAAIRAMLGHPFALDFACFDHRLPPGPSGKFEQFVGLSPWETAP